MEQLRTLKKWHAIVLVALVVCVVFVFFRSRQSAEALMLIGDTRLDVLVADTYAKQFEGLSNRESLGEYDGMLFPFGYSGFHTMVMRDMHFALDFIWIDNGKIVEITPNAAPEPDRQEQDLTRYRPSVPAAAVLEIPAGFSAKFGLEVGDSVKFAE